MEIHERAENETEKKEQVEPEDSSRAAEPQEKRRSSHDELVAVLKQARAAENQHREERLAAMKSGAINLDDLHSFDELLIMMDCRPELVTEADREAIVEIRRGLYRLPFMKKEEQIKWICQNKAVGSRDHLPVGARQIRVAVFRLIKKFVSPLEANLKAENPADYSRELLKAMYDHNRNLRDDVSLYVFSYHTITKYLEDFIQAGIVAKNQITSEQEAKKILFEYVYFTAGRGVYGDLEGLRQKFPEIQDSIGLAGSARRLDEFDKNSHEVIPIVRKMMNRIRRIEKDYRRGSLKANREALTEPGSTSVNRKNWWSRLLGK